MLYNLTKDIIQTYLTVRINEERQNVLLDKRSGLILYKITTLFNENTVVRIMVLILNKTKL